MKKEEDISALSATQVAWMHSRNENDELQEQLAEQKARIAELEKQLAAARRLSSEKETSLLTACVQRGGAATH